jgi:hypothetical protein
MAGKLKPLDVARQVTPGKYPDGDGLYLVVAGPTSRNWSYRYWINGKERWHGLGSLQDVSLKDARIKRDVARQEVRAGVDIVQVKRFNFLPLMDFYGKACQPICPNAFRNCGHLKGGDRPIHQRVCRRWYL